MIVRPIITTHFDDHIGLAVVRSLGKNNIDFQVVSKTKNTLAGYSKYCKNKTIGLNDPDFFFKLSGNDIIFPMVEETMLELAKNKSKLKCMLGFSDYETLQTAGDKSLLIQHAMKHNIPCPKTFFITKPEDIHDCLAVIDFPAVLKPNRGAGGKGIQLINSPEHLPAIAEKILANKGRLLVQEKIPFTAKYTIGALCNFEHELRRVCVIKELRNYPVETGQACYVETVNEPKLVKFAENLLKSLNFVGIADIDLVIDSRDNQPKLMEINPRFWGSLQVAINAGVDFPRLLHTMLINGDVEKCLSYTTGERCRYLIFTDLIWLITILRGNYSGISKRKAVQDFFIHPQNDRYYVYADEDIIPFFGLGYIKLIRKLGLKKRAERL
jgi:predicted ATP-grasp superfamily ATP-dependent carboligase